MSKRLNGSSRNLHQTFTFTFTWSSPCWELSAACCMLLLFSVSPFYLPPLLYLSVVPWDWVIWLITVVGLFVNYCCILSAFCLLNSCVNNKSCFSFTSCFPYTTAHASQQFIFGTEKYRDPVYSRARQTAVMLILVLVFKDSLRTNFKSLSL